MKSWILLKGQALSYFEHHLRKRLEAEDSELPYNDLIELALRDIVLDYIPGCNIFLQKNYMTHPKQLDQDEIIEILDQVKASEWH
jgi:hypothetical protein